MSKKSEFKLINFLIYHIRKINKKMQNHTTKMESKLEKIKQTKNDEFDKLNFMKNIIIEFFKNK